MQTTETKGALVGTMVVGDRLQLRYSSPTGDSSDSIITEMPCRSEEEALDLQDLHRETWGLSKAPRESAINVDPSKFQTYPENDQDW